MAPYFQPLPLSIMLNQAAEKIEHELPDLIPFPSSTPPVTLKNRQERPLQMLLETNQTTATPFKFQSQMRAPIQPKLFRNYRSQIRADAERRRGAP
jgi:hypothetical protein